MVPNNGELEVICQRLKSSSRVLVTSHLLPDGDSVGSVIALTEALQRAGLEARAVQAEPVPDMYKFLEVNVKMEPLSGDDSGAVVVLDCTDTDRLGEELKKVAEQADLLVNIDHHVSNTGFGHLNLVDVKAAATGEIVYDLVRVLGVEISPPMATALYTAIVTDSGSFQYENTCPRSLRVAAELLELGADHALLRANLWENQPLECLLVLRNVLNSLSLDPDGRVAWISLDRKAYDGLHLKSEHCEGLINFPRSIAGVEVAMFFRETEPGTVKVGLRSKSLVDVNELAARFGGGGHPRAAGCTLKGRLDEVIETVVRAAQDMVQRGESRGRAD
ncbi:MAG: bifunctional oligoribonuclease/PAP phosphatase NrnA [Clostridia bacterium]|nr:bifunctional oligoribonuclease/PAP phosphatase NrnA [Clostridia bacterium]